MRSQMTIAIALCTAFAPTDAATAQQTGARRKSPSDTAALSSTRARRYRPSIYNSQSYKGFNLPGQQYRFSIEELMRDRKGILDDPIPSFDPVYHLLMSHNLVPAQSLVVQNALMTAGRNDYRIENGKWVGAAPEIRFQSLTPATITTQDGGVVRPKIEDPDNEQGKLWNPNPGALNETLEQNIEKQVEQHFAQGMEEFRAGNYLAAQGHFELYCDIDPSNPRSRAALTLVSFARSNDNQMLVSLILALKHTQSLDQIRLNRAEFYPEERDFERILSDLNLATRAPNSPPHAKILLAFYRFLGDDISGAISSMNDAIKALEALGSIEDQRRAEVSQVDRTAYATHFRDLLVEAQKNQQKTPPAEPHAN